MNDNNPSLSLAPGEVHVWFAFSGQSENAHLIKRYEGMLCADELDSYQRLQQQEHKLEYLVSHALLRSTLSQYVDKDPADWQFLYNSHGKPSLAKSDSDLDLRFNTAHTNGLAVCAVSNMMELGIDVEFHSNAQALLEVADHYFSDREVAELAKLPKDEQERSFFRYWTLKEAYIKARGEGLAIPSSQLGFEFSSSGQISFALPDSGAGMPSEQWSFHLLSPADNYTSGLAVLSASSTVRSFKAVPAESYEEF